MKESVCTWNPCEFFTSESKNVGQYVMMILNRPVSSYFPTEFLLNLWTKASLRVTVDGGTNRWLSWLKLNNYEEQKHVAPDLVTGDMDSVAKDVLDFFIKQNENIRIIKTPDQNETDFTKALKEVRQYSINENVNIDTVLVLSDSSGRFDHVMGNVNTLFKVQDVLPNVKVILLASNSLTWLLKERTVHSIHIPSKLREAKEWCALIPISHPCTVTSTGLKWNLSNTLLEFGKLVSTSNTYNGEPCVTIQSDGPVVWSMGIKNLL